MRVLGVVVLDVDAEDPFEVAPVEDQQPVAALGAHGANETLGNGVRLWCADRGAHDPDLFAAQDLVERAAVLAVAVADQEPHACGVPKIESHLQIRIFRERAPNFDTPHVFPIASSIDSTRP